MTATKLTTVKQYREALKEAMEIANRAAKDHGLCSVWEDTIQEINEATGLDLALPGGTVVIDTSVISISFEMERSPGETDEQIADRISNLLADALQSIALSGTLDVDVDPRWFE